MKSKLENADAADCREQTAGTKSTRSSILYKVEYKTLRKEERREIQERKTTTI